MRKSSEKRQTYWGSKKFRLFGPFFNSLGAVGSLLVHFLEPLGHRGADFEKQLQKVAQKDVKKGGAQTPLFTLSGSDWTRHRFTKNVKKRT